MEFDRGLYQLKDYPIPSSYKPITTKKALLPKSFSVDPLGLEL